MIQRPPDYESDALPPELRANILSSPGWIQTINPTIRSRVFFHLNYRRVFYELEERFELPARCLQNSSSDQLSYSSIIRCTPIWVRTKRTWIWSPDRLHWHFGVYQF